MKLLDIEKLISLEQKASPGPWHVIHLDDDMHMGAVAITRSYDTSSDENMRHGTWPTDDVIAAFLLQSPPYAMIGDDKFEENAELIASVRNVLPELLRLAKRALEE